jgi:hypothetical protein
LPYFKGEFALNNIEPFVLVVMQVPGRATLGPEDVLKNKETTAVLRTHLEGNRTNTESPILGEAVFACRDSKGELTTEWSL